MGIFTSMPHLFPPSLTLVLAGADFYGDNSFKGLVTLFHYLPPQCQGQEKFPTVICPGCFSIVAVALLPADTSVRVLSLSFLLASIPVPNLSVTSALSLPSHPLSQHSEGL